MPATITVKEFLELPEKDGRVLLDVRRKEDKQTSSDMIPGAAWRDPETVEQWKSELPTDASVVIYCARGGSVSRSVHAALQAVTSDVRYIEGGIEAWKQTTAEKKD